MTDKSSANSVILILFTFSDNLSAENSKLSADFCIQRIQLLECMVNMSFLFPDYKDYRANYVEGYRPSIVFEVALVYKLLISMNIIIIIFVHMHKNHHNIFHTISFY